MFESGLVFKRASRCYWAACISRAFVEDKTGITDFDASLISDFVYVEEYDIFFSQVSDQCH